MRELTLRGFYDAESSNLWGSGGIGSATGRVLRALGYDLHLVGRNADSLATTATELGATFTAGHVTEGSLFSQVAQDAGESLEGLVYAVGTINLRSLGRLTEADFLTDFRVNALVRRAGRAGRHASAQEKHGQVFGGLFSSVAAQQDSHFMRR